MNTNIGYIIVLGPDIYTDREREREREREGERERERVKSGGYNSDTYT